MSSLRLATASNVRAFQSLSDALNTTDRTWAIDPVGLEDEIGRFRVWSGNLGALQKGHSSLDYRLRDSPLLSGNTLKLLEELADNINEAYAIVSGARLPYEEQTRSEDSGNEEDDDGFFSDEDEEDDDTGEPRSELKIRFEEVVDIIDNLYKLSVRIRTPTIRSRSLKAASYTPKDPETGVDVLSTYAGFDLNHVQELLSHLRQPYLADNQDEQDFLTARLSAAVTLRRRQFKYWKRHRDKLAASAIPEEIPQPLNTEGSIPPPLNDASEAQPVIPIIMALREAPSQKTGKTLLSGTEATHHHQSLDEIVDNKSVTSYAVTVKDIHGRGVELPPPPRAAHDGKDFECPYCYIICPARYGRGRPWRTHLLQDLQPYSCTYPHCDSSEQLFRSRREWAEHEASHRKVWRCAEHPEAVYKSPSGLENHLRQKHLDSFPESQLGKIVELGEAFTMDTRPKCPICYVSADTEDLGDFQNHIANHLERIATFALPHGIEDESEGASSTANRGRSTSSGSQHIREMSLPSDSTDEPGQREDIDKDTQQAAQPSDLVERLDPGRTLLSAESLQQVPDESQNRVIMIHNKLSDTNESEDGGSNGQQLANDEVGEVPADIEEHLEQREIFRQYMLSLPGAEAVRFYRRYGSWTGQVTFRDDAAGIEAMGLFDTRRFPSIKFQSRESKNKWKFSAQSLTQGSRGSLSRQSTTDTLGKDVTRSGSPEPIEYEEEDEKSRKQPLLSVADIPTLRSLYRSSRLLQRDQSYAPNDSYNRMISFCYHDLTRLEVDAIVNSSNLKVSEATDALDRAVHKAGGSELTREAKSKAKLKPGQVELTHGHALPCSWVIHAARPTYAGSGSMGEFNILTECYRSALKMAGNYEMKTVAFPCIGTGLSGFPPRVAARIALQEVREYLDAHTNHRFERIIFCVNSAADEKAYMDFFPVFFPPTHGDLDKARTSDWSANRAALAAQILETRAQVQKVRDEIMTGFGQMIPASVNPVTNSLRWIDDQLASIRSFLLGSQELKRSLGDLNLLCSVLLTVCGSLREMTELAKDTVNSGRTHEDIWNDNAAHMLDRHEVSLQEFMNDCYTFATSLDQVLTQGASEAYMVATIRQKLENYGVKQKGQDSEGIRDHLDEVLYIREFQRDASSYNRDVARLPQIFSVAQLYSLGELETKQTLATPSAVFNQAVCLARDDITRIEADVMVNSTDSAFSGMGTLDRTVLKKGGSGLQEEVKKFRQCKEGDVKLTPGYLLPAKHILHVIPPEQYRKNTKDVLRNIYREVLYTAMQMKATSITIPSIGTGMLNYPRRDCASLAMEEVKRFLESAEPTNVLAKIIFVVYSSNDEFIYKSLLPIYFPPSQQTAQAQSGTQATGQPSRPIPTPRRSLFGSVSEALHGIRFGKQPEASRPINSYEEHALIEFEKHAKQCITCRYIERLYVKGRDLCETGYRLAQTLIWYMGMSEDGLVYSRPDKTGKRDRLEVPADTFPFSLLLLRTIEKSNRDKDRESPFVSQRVSTQGQAQRDNEIPADLAVPDLEDVIEQATEPPAKMQAYVCMWKDLPQGWMPISKDYYSVVYVYKHRIDIHEAKSAVQEEGSNIYNNLLPGDDPVLSLDLTPAVTSLMRKSSNEVVISGMRKTFTSFSREGPMLFRCNDRIESDALFDAFQRAINRSRQHPVEKASADAQRLLDYENEVEGLHPQGVAYQILRYLEHDLKSRPGSYIGQRTEEIAYALHEDPVAISASLQELVTQQYVHNTIDGSTWVISRSPTELPVLSTPSVEQAKPDIYLLATRVLSFMEHMNRTPTERKGQTVQDLASALQLPTSDVWAAVRHLTARKEIYRPSDEETWVVTPKAGRLSFLTQETESNDAPDTELAGPNEEATNTSSISERALSWLQRLERTSGRKEHISDLAHGLNTSVAELESVLPKLEAEGMVENTGEDSYWATTLAPMNDSGHPDQSAQQTASWVPSIELTQVNRPSPTPFLSLNDYATAYTDDQGANKVRINKALIDPLIIQEKGLTYQDETHHMVVHQASSEQELFEMAEKTSLLRSGADGRTPDYAPPSRDREDPYWEPPPFNPGLEWTPQLDVYSDDIWHYVSFPASPEPGKKWTRIDKRIVDSQVMDGFTFEILENNLLVQAELSMEQIHDLVEMTRAIRTGKGKEKIKDETVDQPPSYLPLLEHPWTPASVPGFDLSQVTAESIDLQPFVGFGTDGPSLSHGWRRWTQLDKRLVLPDILDEAGLEFIVRGEYFVVPGHLSEKEMRTLIKMSGTCGGNPVKSQTSDNAPRLESKSVVIRDAATFTDMPPSPTAQYGRHGDINPGNILRFDNKQNPEQSGIDAGLLQNMIQQIDASDSSAIPGTRWTRIDQRLVDARVLEAAGEDFESTGDRLILHRVLRRGEIEKWAEETRKIRGEQEVRGDATDDPKTHTIALMESMHRHFGDQVVFIQASSIGEGNTGIWTCIDGRLVDPRILKAATEDFTQNDENTLVLRRVAGLGEIKKWAEKTKEIIEEENQEYGKKRNFWAGQTKLDDVRDESKQAEAGKLQEMGKSGGNTRASREHRSRSESWRDGRGEKDRQQAKLDRILAGDTKEDEQRHYKDFDSYSDADSDADFENAPPSPIQQPTHLIPDAEAWNEDPAPVLDLDIVDIKDYYDNNYTKSRSHARWTRIDKRLLDEQVLIDAEEEFDDRGDRFFYVHRVLRRVEVQLLAEKTRDRRKALREILEKGPLSNTFRSDSKPYIRGGKRLVGLSYQPLDEEQMDVPLPTTATSTDPLPASISELPASNHHCVVYEAGSSSGPLWRWTCCNCGGGNFVAVDAECSHCHNHWRE